MTDKKPSGDLTDRDAERLNVPMERVEAMALGEARQGDAEAFRMLVDQHSHRVFRLAFRITGNEQDAEDIVQETFLRAYRNIGRYDSRASVSTWLHKITSNCSIDLLRKRKRRPTASLDEHHDGQLPASNTPGPERVAAGQEFGRRVNSALSGLSAKERVAFTLRHFEELSIREIAEVMHSPEGSVKNNIFRAVRKLRAVLEPSSGEAR